MNRPFIPITPQFPASIQSSFKKKKKAKVAHAFNPRRQRQVNLSELKAGQDIQGYTEKHPGSHLAQADL
jgi:hypothetical protein